MDDLKIKLTKKFIVWGEVKLRFCLYVVRTNGEARLRKRYFIILTAMM